MKIKLYLWVISMVMAVKLDAQQVITTNFSSSSLNGAIIPLNVYLPQGYNENASPYNLYIFLHGCCGLNHQTHISDFEAQLNLMIANGQIEPLVMVFPSAQGADFGNRHMWHNSERNGQYSDLITSDLLDWITTNYNVSESRRAIGGFSMGADGALRIGLQNSDKFVATISHSSFPALDFFPNLIPFLINEAGQTNPPYTFTPSPGSLTETVYGAASAWSANNDNPNFNVDFPIDSNGQLNEDVFTTWKTNADIETIIRSNWGTSKEVPLGIYVDVGTAEDFFLPNSILNTQLNNLIQAENFQINFNYTEFIGGHILTRQKIETSMIWLQQAFSNITTSIQELPIRDFTVFAKQINHENLRNYILHPHFINFKKNSK